MKDRLTAEQAARASAVFQRLTVSVNDFARQFDAAAAAITRASIVMERCLPANSKANNGGFVQGNPVKGGNRGGAK